MERISKAPKIYVKLSGMITEADAENVDRGPLEAICTTCLETIWPRPLYVWKRLARVFVSGHLEGSVRGVHASAWSGSSSGAEQNHG